MAAPAKTVLRRSCSKTPPPKSKDKERSKSPNRKQPEKDQIKPKECTNETLIVVGDESGGHEMFLVPYHLVPDWFRKNFKKYPSETEGEEYNQIYDFLISIASRKIKTMVGHFVNVSEVISFPGWA
jgi:hypothetical protein